MRCPVRVFAAGLVLLASLGVLPSTPAGAAAPTSHAPILIDGDGDFCDGDDDGVVNCATADGSAANPYVIEGHTLAVSGAEVCVRVEPVLVDPCDAPVACPRNRPETVTTSTGPSLHSYIGALALCQTTKHAVVRDVGIVVDSPTLAVQTGTCDAAEGCVELVVGAAVWGASNVTFERVDIRAYGLALYVGDATDAAGRSWEARENRFLRVSIAGASAVDPTWAPDPLAEQAMLVRVVNADARFEESAIDGRGHHFAVFVDNRLDAALDEAHDFRMAGTTVRGAERRGLSVYASNTELESNRFLENGVASGYLKGPNTQSNGANPSGAVILSSGTYRVVDNEFALGGPGLVGLAVETGQPGVVTFNRFRGNASAIGATALSHFSGEACSPAASYNEFNGLRVVNDDIGCFIDARANWWGQAGGPSGEPSGLVAQAQGRIVFDPWLRLPLDELPKVTVSSPRAGDEVRGVIGVTGTATSGPQNPLVRIEATRIEHAWDRAMTANGLASWTLVWDLDAEPTGDLPLWVRACGKVECGSAVELRVVRVETPQPPVALLKVSPRQPHAGDLVELNASASYSPQGRSVEAYRFRLGDGRETEWLPSPSLETSYSEARSFTASVQVRDSAGLVNTNVADAVVRVGEASLGAASAGSDSVPGAGAPAAALSFAAALLFALRRKK